MGRPYEDLHVDLIKNEPLAGFSEVVARLQLEGATIQVHTSDPDRWEEIALRPIVVPGTGETIHPHKQPERFLESLADYLHGTYLFATKPHPVEECPYKKPWIEMEPVPYPPPKKESFLRRRIRR